MSSVKALLTIAVPFYKGSDYLSRTLTSIFQQRSGGWQVLLVDNSIDAKETDAARSLASKYEQRLRYVRNAEHLHACLNFNKCIDLAETDLVSTVHADDEVLPCYREELLRLADRHPEAAAYFMPVRIIGANSKRRFSFPDWYKTLFVPRGNSDVVLGSESALCSILRGLWINGAAICYRKSKLGDLRWDPEWPMTSDQDLWARITYLTEPWLASSRRHCMHIGDTRARTQSRTQKASIGSGRKRNSLMRSRSGQRGGDGHVQPKQPERRT